MMKLQILFFLFSIISYLSAADVELKDIDVSKLNVRTVKGGVPGSGQDIKNQLTDLIMRVTFREKYMKKKGIEEITAELEEEFAD